MRTRRQLSCDLAGCWIALLVVLALGQVSAWAGSAQRAGGSLGRLSFGQRAQVQAKDERLVQVGRTIVMPPGQPFWVAARGAPVDILAQVLPQRSRVGAATTALR